ATLVCLRPSDQRASPRGSACAGLDRPPIAHMGDSAPGRSAVGATLESRDGRRRDKAMSPLPQVVRSRPPRKDLLFAGMHESGKRQGLVCGKQGSSESSTNPTWEEVPPMIGAISARRSQEQNGVADEAKSVARQIQHARAYAMRKNWTVTDEHVYVDD